MNIYPYSNPLILSDNIFVQYGGQTGTFTASQRSAAYLIAEQQATTYLNTFLLPTTVTGTFSYSPRIVTDYGYVSQIKAVYVLSKNSFTQCTLQSDSGCVKAVYVLSKNSFTQCTLQSDSGCVFVWDDTYGYLDMGCLSSVCNCNNWVVPYQVQVAYTAGLPTGVANQPAMLLALTMAAQISLNEMIFPSQNESTGDIGVEEFSSLDYREKRKEVARNAFGTSARAAKIASLISATVHPARPSLLLR